MKDARVACWGASLIALFVCLLVGTLTSCSPPASLPPASPARDSEPEGVVDWGPGRGLTLWGVSGQFIYGVSREPNTLEVMKWENNTVTKHATVTLARSPLSLAMLQQDRYISYEGKDETWGFRVNSIKTGESIGGWLREKGWSFELSRSSHNGKHIAVWADNGSGIDNQIRVSMLSAKADKTEPVLTTRLKAGYIYRVAPSEDGAYIAFAGWDNGTMLVDVANKKVLWQQGLETDSRDVAFSPDSKILYAGGLTGCVFGMDVRDGAILTRWFATTTGKEVPGHRISTLSVSPDGRFVAAGTGPEGQVFLFSTKSGKLLRMLNHGGSTILITHFSADSKRLATVAVGKIKIWVMPEVGEDE